MARLNYWFAQRAFLVTIGTFLFGTVVAVSAFMGYQPGTTPGGRFVALDAKLTRETDSLKHRLQTVEIDHSEMRNNIRFLVVKSCLELDPQTRRDLIVANMTCPQFVGSENSR